MSIQLFNIEFTSQFIRVLRMFSFLNFSNQREIKWSYDPNEP